jgi:hypothetical protein
LKSKGECLDELLFIHDSGGNMLSECRGSRHLGQTDLFEAHRPDKFTRPRKIHQRRVMGCFLDYVAGQRPVIGLRRA